MVSASTRRLPSTTIRAGGLRNRDARGRQPMTQASTDKDTAEDQATNGQSPNHPHTKSHALRALLIHAAAPHCGFDRRSGLA